MQPLHKTLVGVAGVVAAAAIIGLTWNALRPNSLPLVRKPLHETRGVTHLDETVPQPPIADLSRPAPRRTGTAPMAEETPPVEEPAQPVKPAPEPMVAQPKPSEKPRVAAPVTPKQRKEPKTQPRPKQKTAQAPKPKSTSKSGSKSPSAPPPPRPAPVHVLPAPPKKAEALFTTLDDAKRCFDNRSAIFLDARPIEDYEAGHLAGALWLYFEDLNNQYARVLGGVPKDRLIVTYCSDPECSSAVKLADALCARGHTRVVILLEGLPGWKDAGYPIATGREPG